MKLFNHQFSGAEWDKTLTSWLSHQGRPQNLKEIKKILSYDSRFREQFCEWIKSLRGRNPK